MNSTHDKLRTFLLVLAISLGGTLFVAAVPPLDLAQSASGQTTSQPVRVPQPPPQTQKSQPTPTPAPQQTPVPSPQPRATRPPQADFGTPPQKTKPDNPVQDKVSDADAAAISDDEDEIVRVTSNLVIVPVSVTNERGEPVQGLKATDFRLEEEGRAQEIAQVGDADQVPLDIAILFDVSSSVGQRFAFEQEAAARFLKQVLKPIDRAAIFRIEETPRLEQQLASAEIASASLLKIPAPQKPTPTAFYDSTITAARYLAANAPGRHRRVIVVISDGDDNFSARV